MTLEGHDPGEDQTPAPPARTRWSEDASDDADVLLPPYIPGRAAPKHDARPGETSAGAHGEAPPGALPAKTADPWAEPAEPGSFTAPEPEEVAGTVEPERSASVEPERAALSEGTSGDYPWDGGGSDEEFGPEAVPGPEAGTESEERAEPWVAYGSGGEDEFPFGAFDIEPSGEEGWAEEPTEADSAAPAAASGSLPGPDEMAERVERLAEALRRDGRRGLEREMGSEDRLTSLLAGVLAGYLAGRDG